MKHLFIKLLAALFCALSFNSIQAHFITGSIWYKDDAQGERHYVYLLGDMHQLNYLGLEFQKLTNKKKITEEEGKKVIKTLIKIKDLCVIEDKQVEALCQHVSSCNASDTVIMLENVSAEKNKEKERELTDMLLLEKPIKKSTFDRINDQLATTHSIVILEKRKLVSHSTIKDYAAGDLLLDENLTREKAKKIALEAKQEAETFLDSILVSSSHKELKEFCAKTKTKLVDDFNELARLIDTHAQDFNWLEKLIGRYLFTQKSAGQQVFKQLILKLDMSILDASILHTLTTNETKKHIYVCAGAAHIHGVEWELRHFGYKKFDQSYRSPTFTALLKSHFSHSLPARQNAYTSSDRSYIDVLNKAEELLSLNIPALNITDFFSQAHHAQPTPKHLQRATLITAAAIYSATCGLLGYAAFNSNNNIYIRCLSSTLCGIVGAAGLSECLMKPIFFPSLMH